MQTAIIRATDLDIGLLPKQTAVDNPSRPPALRQCVVRTVIADLTASRQHVLHFRGSKRKSLWSPAWQICEYVMRHPLRLSVPLVTTLDDAAHTCLVSREAKIRRFPRP